VQVPQPGEMPIKKMRRRPLREVIQTRAIHLDRGPETTCRE
jgi:hypothetical protein